MQSDTFGNVSTWKQHNCVKHFKRCFEKMKYYILSAILNLFQVLQHTVPHIYDVVPNVRHSTVSGWNTGQNFWKHEYHCFQAWLAMPDAVVLLNVMVLFKVIEQIHLVSALQFLLATC
jgi:hypothetical protein